MGVGAFTQLDMAWCGMVFTIAFVEDMADRMRAIHRCE